MKFHFLIPIVIGTGLFVGCEAEQSSEVSAEPPPAPAKVADPEARAALEAQAIGSKLLGKTVRLSGDSFQPVDLHFAPEAYFVYYSASW